jgi:hypothetical protein
MVESAAAPCNAWEGEAKKHVEHLWDETSYSDITVDALIEQRLW